MAIWLRLWLLFPFLDTLVLGQSLSPVPIIGPSSSSVRSSVCNLLQNQTPERIQMFGAADGSLYLMVDGEVTQVPLSNEYVDPSSRKMALYQRDDDFKELGPWPSISWLSGLADQISSDGIASVNIHVNHSAHGQPNRVIWHVLTNRNQSLLWYKDSQKELVTLPGDGDFAPEYRVVGDGTGRRVYHLLMEPKLGEVVMVSTFIGKSPWIHPGINNFSKGIQLLQSGNSVIFRYQTSSDSSYVTPSPKLTPLLPELSGLYGFIYQKIIHLWDLKNRSVLLFRDPWQRNKHLKSTQFYRVPLAQYLACSDHEWNSRKSEPGLFREQPPLAPMQPDYTWIWVFLGIALLALVVCLVVAKLVWAQYGPSLSLESRWKRSKSPRNRPKSKSPKGSRGSGGSKKTKKKKKQTASPSSKTHGASSSSEQDFSISQ